MCRIRRSTALSISVVLAVSAAACTLGPDYRRPELDVPDVWQSRAVAGIRDGQAPSQTWWEMLGDPVLIDLLERAREANLNLAIAVARIREARAAYRISRSDWWPEVDVEGGAAVQELSKSSYPTTGGERTEDYRVGAGMSWELDIFGRVRRSAESASASFEATIEDYRDVLVVLMADVGLNYVDAITNQYRIELAEENVAKQTDSLQLTRDRFDAGLTSALDVSQAESNLASTEATIPRLEARVNAALNRLAVLLGENPGSVHDEILGATRIPGAPAEIAVGIPADIVRQRPDIRRAERELAASTARIGVAKADLYPRFALTGFLGLQSPEIGDLTDGDSVTWSVGLPFIGNLFDGGARRGRVEVERARTEQALAYYKLTVLGALEEVENALVNLAQERMRRDRLARAVEATRRSVELVRTQYRAGLTDFQNVLDSERSLTGQQDALAESEGLVIGNLIALYRALGGGWQPDPENTESFTSAVFD